MRLVVFAHTFASSQREHSDAVKTRTTGTVAGDDTQLRMGCTRNALALWKASAFTFATGLVSIYVDDQQRYRGFVPKTGGVRIITFRDTTRMHSKSNRCI